MPDRRVALVTGASRGIGRAIALALAERGWSVAINYRSDLVSAQDVLRIANKYGGKNLLVQADISRAEERNRMVEEVLKRFGRLDLLVNNAGRSPG